MAPSGTKIENNPKRVRLDYLAFVKSIVTD